MEGFGIAEFGHYLAADAAGGAVVVVFGFDVFARDGDGGEIAVAFVDGAVEGGAIGAVGGAVGGVFDVAAFVDGAVGAEEGGAYVKAGVGGVGFLLGVEGVGN